MKNNKIICFIKNPVGKVYYFCEKYIVPGGTKFTENKELAFVYNIKEDIINTLTKAELDEKIQEAIEKKMKFFIQYWFDVVSERKPCIFFNEKEEVKKLKDGLNLLNITEENFQQITYSYEYVV